jgi:uncharacterized membrane protein
MAFCAKCGASLGAGAVFCGSCGTPVASAAPPAGGAPQASPPPAGAFGPAPQSTGMTSNVAGALAYLVGFITGIIFLVIEPYNKDPFVRFHAFQSIFLSVFCIVLFMVWGAISGTLFLVSLGFFWSLMWLVWLLLRIAFFLLWLYMMYKAYNNERYSLPFIGPLAAKQAG